MQIPRNQKAVPSAAAIGGRRTTYSVEGVEGLFLLVTPAGSRSWLVRYSIGKGRAGRRQRTVTLGDAQTIKLADAAERARQLRAGAILNKEDEAADRRGEGDVRMDGLFDLWLDRYAKALDKAKGRSRVKDWPVLAERWRRLVSPKLGAVPARELRRAQVAEIRDEIARDRGVLSNRVVALIIQVLNWAVDADIIEVNPAAGLRKQREGARTRMLDERALGRYLAALADADISTEMRDVLLLLVLLGQRRVEIAGMMAEEVERAGRAWRLPATRTKNRREHLVPLLPLPLAILSKYEVLRGPLFVARGKHAITLSAVTRSMARITDAASMPRYSPHDLRRTMNTMLAKMRVPQEVRKALLNHTERSTEGKHYNVHDFYDEKREALERWHAALRPLLPARLLDRVAPGRSRPP